MQQVLPRVKAMPLDNRKPYYTVEAQQNHMIRAKNQVLQVVAGLAWVAHNGEDFIVKAGEAITLFKGGDGVVMVSGLYGKPMQYTLSE